MAAQPGALPEEEPPAKRRRLYGAQKATMAELRENLSVVIAELVWAYTKVVGTPGAVPRLKDRRPKWHLLVSARLVARRCLWPACTRARPSVAPDDWCAAAALWQEFIKAQLPEAAQGLLTDTQISAAINQVGWASVLFSSGSNGNPAAFK